MFRTTIYLPDALHKGLKHLAVEKSCSMAYLLREAVERTYEVELEDVKAAQHAWRAHVQQPEKAIPAKAYFSRRKGVHA